MAWTTAMWITRCVVVLLLPLSLSSSLASAKAFSISCGKCKESQCPELHYCEGIAVKDHCGCCSVCSSSRYQPHPLITNTKREGSACAHVECPKYKVCVENMQSLPLCTCPSTYICRSRKKRQRPVCGSDGITYQSRCYLRVAACNTGTRIKVTRKGPCDNAQAPALARTCDSVSTCRRRKNQRAVCGTDGKTYFSRCYMKIMACQRGVKVKLRNYGVCQKTSINPGPSIGQRVNGGDVISADVTRGSGSPSSPASSSSYVRRRQERRRQRKNGGGNDADGSDDSENRRKKRRREKRKKRKERRRKRRKTRGKRRSRRYKVNKNTFRKTFGHITWK